MAYLRATDGVQQIEVAGSFRPRRETVGDIDIVVAAEPPEPILRRFTSYEDVREIVERVCHVDGDGSRV